MTHLAVVLNHAAQGRISGDDIAAWFTALTPTEQHLALHHLALFIGQTRVTPTSGELATIQAALTGDADPAITVTRANASYAVQRIAVSCPASDAAGAFGLLLALFSGQDRRCRATQCATGCTHWWHQLHRHAGAPGFASAAGEPTVLIAEGQDRRAVVYPAPPADLPGRWLVRLEMPALHEQPSSGTWFGGRILRSHAQPDRPDAIRFAQLWLDTGVYVGGPEDCHYGEAHFSPLQPGVFIGQCERCHACGYDCPGPHCGQFQTVPVVHTGKSGFLVCRDHLDDDTPVHFRTGAALTGLA